jgi:hypothetical protein
VKPACSNPAFGGNEPAEAVEGAVLDGQGLRI